MRLLIAVLLASAMSQAPDQTVSPTTTDTPPVPTTAAEDTLPCPVLSTLPTRYFKSCTSLPFKSRVVDVAWTLFPNATVNMALQIVTSGWVGFALAATPGKMDRASAVVSAFSLRSAKAYRLLNHAVQADDSVLALSNIAVAQNSTGMLTVFFTTVLPGDARTWSSVPVIFAVGVWQSGGPAQHGLGDHGAAQFNFTAGLVVITTTVTTTTSTASPTTASPTTTVVHTPPPKTTLPAGTEPFVTEPAFTTGLPTTAPVTLPHDDATTTATTASTSATTSSPAQTVTLVPLTEAAVNSTLCNFTLGSMSHFYRSCVILEFKTPFRFLWTILPHKKLAMAFQVATPGWAALAIASVPGSMDGALGIMAHAETLKIYSLYAYGVTLESDTVLPLTDITVAHIDGVMTAMFTLDETLLGHPLNDVPILYATGPWGRGFPSQHQGYDSNRAATVAFASGTSSTAAQDHSRYLQRSVHGWLMVGCWGLLLPVGTFFPRFFKLGTPLWFKIHMYLQIGALLGATVAFALGLNTRTGTQPLHGGLGIAVMVCGYVVALAGILRPAIGAPTRARWALFHFWIARIAILLAMANIWIGMHVFGLADAYNIAYGVFLVVLVGFFLVWTGWPPKFEPPPSAASRQASVTSRDPSLHRNGNSSVHLNSGGSVTRSKTYRGAMNRQNSSGDYNGSLHSAHSGKSLRSARSARSRGAYDPYAGSTTGSYTGSYVGSRSLNGTPETSTSLPRMSPGVSRSPSLARGAAYVASGEGRAFAGSTSGSLLRVPTASVSLLPTPYEDRASIQRRASELNPMIVVNAPPPPNSPPHVVVTAVSEC